MGDQDVSELLRADEKGPERETGRESYEPKKYDLFISYKSESIAVVRPVVEALKANGLNVWFNEYELLKSSFWSSDVQLSMSLSQAASSSAAAILFLDNAWAASYWCGEEMKRLLKALPAERLLAVCQPQNEPDSSQLADRKAQLSSCRSVSFNGLQAMLDTLNNLKWFPSKLANPEVTPRKRIRKDKALHIARLDGGVYSKIRARVKSFRTTGFIEDRQMLSTLLNGRNVNFQIAYHPARTLEYLEKVPNLVAAEDRQIFRELIPFADWWVREGRGDKDPGGELVGIHLVQAPSLLQGSERRGHFGATFRVDYGSVNNMIAWIRKYCFIIPNGIACGELDFDFIFYIPKGTREAEMKQFCELIGYTDEIVHSFICSIYLV